MTENTLASIESIGLPLAYKLAQAERDYWLEAGTRSVVVEARSLVGMQKEALVHQLNTGTTWRMVSDEGPYLNGTDLAPFPLAFYATGMAFSLLAVLIRQAQTNDYALESVRMVQDNYYTMQGSAIRGDMLGGALPTEITLDLQASEPPDKIAALVRQAEAASAAQSYMRDVLRNTFSLEFNGEPIAVEEVPASPTHRQPDPTTHFESASPDSDGHSDLESIRKLAAAESVQGVEGGAGSSLQSEQKRMLHVRTEAHVRSDGLFQSEVQLFKPIGSSFQFVGDESGELAPPALSYLGAGVGFCFMTQLGRYARIVKQDLSSHRIVQFNRFTSGTDGSPVRAHPVDTHVFVTLNDTKSHARQLLRMGERTCFLHAAMRSSNPSRLSANLNGQSLELD